MQIGRIAFLKLAVREALLHCTLVPSLNKVPRDIDAQHVRPESSGSNLTLGALV